MRACWLLGANAICPAPWSFLGLVRAQVRSRVMYGYSALLSVSSKTGASDYTCFMLFNGLVNQGKGFVKCT